MDLLREEIRPRMFYESKAIKTMRTRNSDWERADSETEEKQQGVVNGRGAIRRRER